MKINHTEVTKVVERNYTIALNEAEMRCLAALCGKVGGTGEMRNVADQIYWDYVESIGNDFFYSSKEVRSLSIVNGRLVAKELANE